MEPASRAIGQKPLATTTRGATFQASLANRTPLSSDEAAHALSRAWQAEFGEAAPPRAVGVLWAQWALETGRGRSMYGFNFGNLKGAGPGGRSTLLDTREGYGASERGVHARFRAYDSVDEGARDYIRTLAERYPGAIAAARAGSATGFVGALERGHYFTANPIDYMNGVRALAGEFERGGAPLRVDQPNRAEQGVIDAFARAIARQRG